MKLYNGWRLYAFEPFAERLAGLKVEVGRLKARHPKGYRSHPTTILLAAVYKATAQDPVQSQFGWGIRSDRSTRTGVA